jgi:tetratricopeptide (TPR) repeat protein
VRSLTYYLSEQELELIAQAYTATEQYDPVLLISATKDSETVARILHAISHKIALIGQYERALKLAQALKCDGGSSVLADVIEVAVEAGHYEEILKTAQALESDSCKDYALVLIADYYAVTGQYNQALELVQTVDNAYKAQSLVSIANYLGVVGQKERASELLIQALQINQNLPLENKLSMVEIAIGLAAAGQYDQALKLASTLEPSGNPQEDRWALQEKTLALAGIAAYYAANEQIEDALKVLNQALEFDKIASRGYRCRVTFVRPMLYEIANRYAAMGQYDQSLQIGPISQDEFFKLELLNEVIPKYVEASKKRSRQIRLASIPEGQCGG